MKLKPFLDSFQACFKYHIFAGLYFIYRLLSPLVHVLCRTTLQEYVVVELLLFIVLFLHAVVHPYEKMWHNGVDLLLLTILLSVNTLTIFNYYAAVNGTFESGISTLSITQIQIVLLLLPLIYVCSYATYSCYKMKKPLCKKKDDSAETVPVVIAVNDGLECFPPRLLADESSRPILCGQGSNQCYRSFKTD